MSSLVRHQAPSSSCQYIIMSPQDCTSRDSYRPVHYSRQSDTTEISISRVDQDSVSACDCISVSQAGFSGEQVLALWSMSLATVDVSDAVGCCSSSDDRGTPSQPTQATRYPRSSPCRNHSSEGATAEISRISPEAASICDPIGPTQPDGRNEAVGDLGRRSHQNCPRRWRRGGVRNCHRTRGQVLGRK